MNPMEDQQAGQAVRVVIAAPFKEIVGIHERTTEYADELDVCGVVSSADAVAEQAELLRPDVLVISEDLGIDPMEAALRVAAVAPATRLVMLARSGDTVPRGAADVVARMDASASELRGAIMVAAGRLRAPAAPPAHARDDDIPPDQSRWFWEQPAPAAGTGHRAAPGLGEAASPPGTPAQSAPAHSTWPPPWLRIEQDPATPESEPEAAPEAEPEPVPAAQPVPVPLAGGSAIPVVSADAEAPAAPARGWSQRQPDPTEQAQPPVFDLAFTATEAAVPERTVGGRPVPAPESAPAEARGAAVTTVPTWKQPAPPSPDEAGTPDRMVDTVQAPAAPAISPSRGPSAAASAPAADPEPIVEQPRKRTRRPGRTKADTVLVFSGKGGVGKSVLATNLAVALSAQGAKVALIDLNLQYGDVAVLLHVEAHPTSIESLAQQGEQVDRDYLDEVMATGPEEVRVLLAPASPEFADLVTAASLRAILRELSRNFDFVVVDSPAHLEERILEVMEVADQILVVSSFNITAVKDTKVTLKLLHSLGIERDRVAVILNQTQAKAAFPRQEIETSLKLEVLAHLPFDPRIDDTIDNGRPMVVSEPRSEFSKQIRTIVDFLTSDNTAGEEPRTSERSGHKPAKRRLFGR